VVAVVAAVAAEREVVSREVAAAVEDYIAAACYIVVVEVGIAAVAAEVAAVDMGPAHTHHIDRAVAVAEELAGYKIVAEVLERTKVA
jgi:hypothetical protein